MKRFAAMMFLLVPFACGPQEGTHSVVVGSKNFTESVILGELLAQELETAGCSVERRLNMGGTFVADKAMEAGSLDTYVEYTGTALTAILHRPSSSDAGKVRRDVERAYRARHMIWGHPLGFNNTFAMIVRQDDAARLGLRRISDLAKVQRTFRPGFGYEFAERPDGWKGLLTAYGLQFATSPATMDLGLTYKALAAGRIDLIAGNSTDGLIESLGLVILDDDRRYFPPYEAAVVYRDDLALKCRKAPSALQALAGRIDDAAMRRLNFEVDGRKRDVGAVVREWRKR